MASLAIARRADDRLEGGGPANEIERGPAAELASLPPEVGR